MSFLSDTEAASLRIARMSLHIVGEEDFQPALELSVQHDDFLLGRIKDIASPSIYRFDEASSTKTIIENICNGTVSFEAGAQELARQFCRMHKVGTKSGAFFVFELRVDDENIRIYALMKYDYSHALERVEESGVSGLRKIVEALVGDKIAIQKSALVRVVGRTAELPVSTRDRMGRPSPELTDYFGRYLQVVRERNDADLTEEAKTAIKNAIEDCKEFIPQGGTANAVSRALDVLRNCETVTEEVIHQAVWVGAGQPADEATRGVLKTAADRAIKRKKLAGIAFPPHKGRLGRPLSRQVRTDEGVTIEYSTSLEGGAVRKIDNDDGTTQFVVTTRGYRDAVLPEGNGRRHR